MQVTALISMSEILFCLIASFRSKFRDRPPKSGAEIAYHGGIRLVNRWWAFSLRGVHNHKIELAYDWDAVLARAAFPLSGINETTRSFLQASQCTRRKPLDNTLQSRNPLSSRSTKGGTGRSRCLARNVSMCPETMP
jgi:hypothetical protein